MTKTISLKDLNLINHCCEWTIYHSGWDEKRDENDFPNPSPSENELVEQICYFIPGRGDDNWTDFRGMSLTYLGEDDDDLVDVTWEGYFQEPLDMSFNLQLEFERRFGDSIIYNQEEQTLTYDETEVDESDLFDVDDEEDE